MGGIGNGDWSVGGVWGGRFGDAWRRIWEVLIFICFVDGGVELGSEVSGGAENFLVRDCILCTLCDSASNCHPDYLRILFPQPFRNVLKRRMAHVVQSFAFHCSYLPAFALRFYFQDHDIRIPSHFHFLEPCFVVSAEVVVHETDQLLQPFVL